MIKSPRGTRDILPDEWAVWKHVLNSSESVAEEAGFRRIDVPTFEAASLFTHATGEHTDVKREMYTFEDRGGEELALRPEGTASVFRAYVEHGMHKKPQPVKLYYIGSMFRYERPQSGRAREHHQFGCEAIGSDDPLLDASLIDLQGSFYRRAGIAAVSIHINSIGDSVCRPAYLRELVRYLKSHETELCQDCRGRIERNPLRVLDCKQEFCQPVLNQAPRSLDHLCIDCRDHWLKVLQALKALDIEVEVDARLVRGLDYYTRTVWEFQPPTSGGAQSVLGGGGRYDALGPAIGAPVTPGVGFSTGLERVTLNLPPSTVDGLAFEGMDVFVAHIGDQAEIQALTLSHQLRENRIRTDMAFGHRSLRAQLKQANASGARIAVLIGDEEVAQSEVSLRDLSTGEQKRVDLQGAVDTVIHELNREGALAT